MNKILLSAYRITIAAFFLFAASLLQAEPLKVGASAPDFTLTTLDEKPVELKKLTSEKPVVLVVLRGWPGYQCPACTKQVSDFVARASDFAAEKAQVVMVYPGPAENLKAHAQDFLKQKDWPKHFFFVLDPDYTLTKAYGVRWEAKNETAYPSSFVIDRAGKIRFAYVSKGHGDRVSSETALKALQELK